MAMFLFTTPSVRDAAAPSGGPVVDAIRQGAERTGTGFDYLLATAQRESALDPAARARTSSASGLFQFIEQTWLGLVKAEGPRLGLGQHAAAITTRADGSHVVADPAARQAILDLREDPKVASVLAGTFTQRNREALSGELGREPKPGELYVAHFLGARGAAQLIQTARQSPGKPVARDFPEVAAANRTIFYDRTGRARSAAEVYALLASSHAASAPIDAAPAFAPDRPLAFAQKDGPAFHGLFQTDTRRGPISDAVAKLWKAGGADGQGQTAALGFFPKGGATAAAAVDDGVKGATDLPLPSLVGAAPDAPRNEDSPAAPPLDLGSFMKRRRK
jgi:hypothetical protein